MEEKEEEEEGECPCFQGYTNVMDLTLHCGMDLLYSEHRLPSGGMEACPLWRLHWKINWIFWLKEGFGM